MSRKTRPRNRTYQRTEDKVSSLESWLVLQTSSGRISAAERFNIQRFIESEQGLGAVKPDGLDGVVASC